SSLVLLRITTRRQPPPIPHAKLMKTPYFGWMALTQMDHIRTLSRKKPFGRTVSSTPSSRLQFRSTKQSRSCLRRRISMPTIKLKLNDQSINQAVKELKAYQKKVDGAGENLTHSLTEQGVSLAQLNASYMSIYDTGELVNGIESQYR